MSLITRTFDPNVARSTMPSLLMLIVTTILLEGIVAGHDNVEASSCPATSSAVPAGPSRNNSISCSPQEQQHGPSLALLPDEDVPTELLQKYNISQFAYVPTPPVDVSFLGAVQLYDPMQRDVFLRNQPFISLKEFSMEYQDIKEYIEDMILKLQDEEKDAPPHTLNRREQYERHLDIVALDKCVLKDARCMIWGMQGFCGGADDGDFTTPAEVEHFMAVNCCPFCEELSHLNFLARCPKDPEAYNAFAEPGEVTLKFQSLLKKTQHLNSKILSAPIKQPGLDYEYHIGGPWIVTMDDFLSKEETERLRMLATKHGYRPSGDAGRARVPWRNSTEAWCTKRCQQDPIVAKILNRLENTVSIPQTHSDDLQLLRYYEGQFYATHQDYHPHQAFSQTGSRVLTFYMYLSDVEEGGGTNFPFLNITVQPKEGRALVWSNVRDDNPNEEDLSARHQALPMGKKGVKYGATAWFHQRDFQNANNDCGR